MLKVRQHSITSVQDEARALVSKGCVGRQCQIYSLSKYFSKSEWAQVERVLDDNEYLLRDFVCDLIGHESWDSD